MPRYEVTITQQIRRTYEVIVKAGHPDDAKEMARDAIENGDLTGYERCYDSDTNVRKLPDVVD